MIIPICVFIYLFIVLYRSAPFGENNNKNFAYVIILALPSLFPLLDFTSDIVYLISNIFWNPIIFSMAVTFTLSPSIFGLLYFMYKRNIFPEYSILEPIETLNFNRWKPYIFYDKYDSFNKIVSPLILPFLYFICLLPYLIINIKATALFIVGVFIYGTKLMPLRHVQNYWIKAFMGKYFSEEHELQENYDLTVFNESFTHELFFETLPLFIIQIYNNSQIRTWNFFAMLSILFSGGVLTKSAYSIMYQNVIKKKNDNEMNLLFHTSFINNNLSVDEYN